MKFTYPPPIGGALWGILAIVLFMSLVDVSNVDVALLSMQRGLAATEAQLQWVLSGYTLTFGV